MEQKIFLCGSDTLIADALVTNVMLDIHTGKTLPIDAATVDFWPDLAAAVRQSERPAGTCTNGRDKDSTMPLCPGATGEQAQHDNS